ncbi:HD family phosphohydrolase [Clostridium akagii]|uniref:HD family phosphohydrolase n=1 Tax=Clostridium akagii TaxID=91623 RepID=UPI000561C819|nr:HDIG domain-containing metalloprotein [Clostridium akagii]
MKITKIIRGEISKKTFIFFIAFIIIYAIMLTSIVPKTYNLKEGEIANIDIKAQRDVEDKTATDEREKEAADSVGQQYDKNEEVETESEQDLNSGFDKINGLRAQNIDINQKQNMFRSYMLYNNKLTAEQINTWMTISVDDNNNLQSFILKTIKGMFSNGIKEDDDYDKKNAENYINSQFSKSKFKKEVAELGIIATEYYIKPNLFINQDKTSDIKNSAKKKVAPVMIKKGQLVVKEGEPVTKQQLDVLSDLGLLNNNKNSNWYIYVSLGALDFIILFIQGYYLYKKHNELFKNNNNLILIFLLNIVFLILARTINIISPFLIPLAFLPMLLTILLDERVSLFISLFNCILMSTVVEFNMQIILIAIMSTLITSLFLKKMQMRNDILYASLYIGIANSILTFSIGFLVINNFFDILETTAFAFVGAFISAILTIGFLPILENVFNIVTAMKLLELSNPNQKLLKRLLVEAPGTYHHSIMVANLAEVAAEKVGGNQVLARVASYYHDIGKVVRPYFFKENQFGTDNPHDKMTPNLSALVVISHVKDGLELAEEYKLPKAIKDVIAEHHGTTLAKYFYITMKNSADNPEEIVEENFRYPGPIPRTKESAIIMIADSVEAAVRSIQEPTKGKIEEMVNNIITSKLNEGQLDDCDLTFRELNEIRKAFLSALNGIYHQRIEYPTDKSQLGQKKGK